MKPVRQKKVRETLLAHPDGLSTSELSRISGIPRSNVRTALRAMPDVYVDRWVRGKRNSYEKVWCCVVVPEDCPHPTDKVFKGGRGTTKTVWQKIGSWGIGLVAKKDE